MTEFLLGVFSSLVATLIIFLSRFLWAPAINWAFSSIYPNIAGRYRLVLATDVEDVPEHIDDVDELDLSTVPDDKLRVNRFITIHQFANYLRGSVEATLQDGTVVRDNFRGRITPTRMIVISYASESREHHDYGAGLYRLTPSGNELNGHYMFLCSCCEEASSVSSYMKKVK